MSESQRAPGVLVAMSGGVDSALAAALLLEQGYQIAGATLQFEHGPSGEQGVARARHIAALLGIPFQVVHAEEAFAARVVEVLVSAYAAGRTPNPCVVCNSTIKFGLLLEQGLAQGYSVLATGHYARVERAGQCYQLLRGQDPLKDQSYFLHSLTQPQLAHSMFPLGALTKEAVRTMAAQRGLASAALDESQDICFLKGADYRHYMAQRAPHLFEPGPVRDTTGRVLGQHQGLPAYTIGQRKGLGISSAEPLYVLAVVPEENAVIVGPATALDRHECHLDSVHFIAGQPPSERFQTQVEIRYRARPIPATVETAVGSRAAVHFHQAQRGVAPGQYLVMYEGEVVLGGGTISS